MRAKITCKTTIQHIENILIFLSYLISFTRKNISYFLRPLGFFLLIKYSIVYIKIKNLSYQLLVETALMCSNYFAQLNHSICKYGLNFSFNYVFVNLKLSNYCQLNCFIYFLNVFYCVKIHVFLKFLPKFYKQSFLLKLNGIKFL